MNCFEPIQLPPKCDIAVLHRLWSKLRSNDIGKFEKDDLNRQVVALINERVTCDSWERSLAKEMIEPEDAAQYCAAALWKRLPNISLRINTELALVSYLMRSIDNLLISRTRQNKRKSELHAKQQSEAFGFLNSNKPDDVSTHICGLIDHLNGVGDEFDFDPSVKQLYDYLVAHVASGNGIPAFDRMPRYISAAVGADVYAIAVYRVNKEVASFADAIG